MRALFLAACLCSVPAVASEPGQPLDCSDWVFDEPGLSCRELLSYDCRNNPACWKGTNSQTDSQGRLLWLRQVIVGICGSPQGANVNINETQIIAMNLTTGSETILARLRDRCTNEGSFARLDRAGPVDFSCPQGGCDNELRVGSAVTFDRESGRLLFAMTPRCGNSNCSSCCHNYPHEGQVELVAIEGFPTTFDVLQTFTPTANALGFRVPYMPEGLPAADHFDTYYGPLTHPINFSQAQGLACGYPAAVPAVGDYLEVADPLPDPAPGTGRYYVTSATYQGQTRYGRRTSGGVLSGRDPVALPTCE